MTFVTFITPTTGKRPTELRRTWDSIHDQTDPDWRHIVAFDFDIDDEGASFFDHGITSKKLLTLTFKPVRSAGLARNYGVELALDEGTQWIAFVDDDDIVTDDYVAKLREHTFFKSNADLIVFRMDDPILGVLPDVNNPQLEWGNVGISFAVNAKFLQENDLKFIKENLDTPGPEGNEDINFLKQAIGKGAEVFISPHLTYRVRPYSD